MKNWRLYKPSHHGWTYHEIIYMQEIVNEDIFKRFSLGLNMADAKTTRAYFINI